MKCHAGQSLVYHAGDEKNDPYILESGERSPPYHGLLTGANDIIEAEMHRMVTVMTGLLQTKSQVTKISRAEKVIRDPKIAKSRLVSCSSRNIQ